MPKKPVIYALCPDPEAAQRAVEGLRRAGIEARNIAVVSSEPFEGYEFSRRDHQTPMPWLAALGGLAGGTAGYFLAALTQRSYPLPTGNMPIVALWPTGVIVYEMTMLGAILVTLFTMFISARLPNWRAQLYDPAVSDGMILVGATNLSQASRIEANRVLGEAAGGQVKEVGL